MILKKRKDLAMKRTFDIAVAIVGIIFLLPLMLLVSVLIVLDSGFPVLFKQKRVGQFGRDFRIFKFRTMTVAKGSENGSFDAGNLQRVTNVGRILRKSKLDELPQLWNVVNGEMSLVGPRPEVRKWVDEYPDCWKSVHTVRPGITDPASIQFRNEEDILACAEDPEAKYREEILPAKLKCYKAYIAKRSLIGDFFIILSTFKVLFK
jgi:lipopolysaccharide/colanic/teichoic acid biosynthesis glycosyltransferase